MNEKLGCLDCDWKGFRKECRAGWQMGMEGDAGSLIACPGCGRTDCLVKLDDDWKEEK